jgi:hypothetical protein
VLHLLLAAYPDAIDLTNVLKAPKDVVYARVKCLRRRHHDIKGSPHGHGYWYEHPPDGRRHTRAARTVKVKAAGSPRGIVRERSGQDSSS